MDKLYIVIYRYSAKDKWQPKVDGCFTERRLAENFVEILSGINSTWEYAIVEGPIVSPKTMAEAEAALGAF